MIYKRFLSKKRIGLILTGILSVLLVFVCTGCNNGENLDIEQQPETPEINIPQEENGLNESSMNVIDVDATNDKMVDISTVNAGRSNPFMPSNNSETIAKESLKYELLEPPTEEADSGTQKIVTTKVSGIMYDRVHPSAILNIDKSDYLVRSGDVIDGYKILSIGPKVVTLQLGRNIYKAGVGQIIDPGDGQVNYNTISNLSNKFGGSRRN